MKPKPITSPLSLANSHPVITTLLSFLFFASVPLAISANEKLADNPYAWVVGTSLVFGLGSAWFMALRRNSKKLALAIITVALLAGTMPTKAEDPKPVAAIGVGAVVICVGGYCVYKIVQICAKKFPPKSTNAPPEELNYSGTDESAAAYEYSSIGSCYTPPELSAFQYDDPFHNPTTFTINVTVEPDRVVTSMSANNNEGTTQDWNQFTSEMAEHGLFLTGHPTGRPQYSKNGIPCDETAVPLSFDLATGRVTQRSDGNLKRITVMRSYNLSDWSPFFSTDVASGTRFGIVDTVRQTQMFYRVEMTTP